MSGDRIQSYNRININVPDDVVRTKDYVEQECKNLIDQIIKYFKKGDK